MTPERQFIVRKADSKSYRPYTLHQARPGSTDRGMDSLRIFNSFHFAPYCVYEYRIADIMSHPEFEIESCEELEYLGQPALVVNWNNTFEDEEEKFKRYGQWTFATAAGWVLLRSEYTPDRTKGVQLRELDYEGTISGIPLLKEFRHYSFPSGQDKKINLRFVSEKTEIGPAPPVRFLESEFGLPKLVFHEETPRSWMRWFWILGGLLSLAIGTWLFRSKQVPNSVSI